LNFSRTTAYKPSVAGDGYGIQQVVGARAAQTSENRWEEGFYQAAIELMRLGLWQDEVSLGIDTQAIELNSENSRTFQDPDLEAPIRDSCRDCQIDIYSLA
jgi:hypothetical protein